MHQLCTTAPRIRIFRRYWGQKPRICTSNRDASPFEIRNPPLHLPSLPFSPILASFSFSLSLSLSLSPAWSSLNKSYPHLLATWPPFTLKPLGHYCVSIQNGLLLRKIRALQGRTFRGKYSQGKNTTHVVIKLWITRAVHLFASCTYRLLLKARARIEASNRRIFLPSGSGPAPVNLLYTYRRRGRRSRPEVLHGPE